MNIYELDGAGRRVLVCALSPKGTSSQATSFWHRNALETDERRAPDMANRFFRVSSY